MGICWGSPNFPSPSFGRSFRNGPDLTLSSSVSDTASSVPTNSHSNRAASDGAVVTLEVLNSPPRHKELRVFKFKELKAMMGNFSYPPGETHFDGKDVVHCRWLEEGRVVKGIAVKVIEFPRKPSRLKHSIVQANVKSYGSLSHDNLAQLLGYCLKGREFLLVYHFPRYYLSLEDHLLKSSQAALPWHRRIQIAVEAARGLAHLHLMDYPFLLLHFQASDVLLDKSYAVKIAPFNFLDTGSPDNAGRMKSRNAVGTKVRKDAATGDPNKCLYRRKQDVHDFGVFLLEILTGLALDRNRWSPEYGLRIEWIKERLLDIDNLATLMDSNMGSYPLDDAFQVAQLAVRCVRQFPLSRPTMPQIEGTLRQIKAAEISFAVTTESVST